MSHRSHRRRRSGFTLLELLVVLTIIATLLTLAAPRFFQHVGTAKEAALRETLQTTRAVIDQFYGDNGRYPESLDELVERRYLRAAPFDPITESATTWSVEPVPEDFEGSVYDLKSGASGVGRNGVPYAEW